MPVVTVSEMLGHGKPSATLDIYGYMIRQKDRDYAEQIADSIGLRERRHRANLDPEKQWCIWRDFRYLFVTI